MTILSFLTGDPKQIETYRRKSKDKEKTTEQAVVLPLVLHGTTEDTRCGPELMPTNFTRANKFRNKSKPQIQCL